MNSKTLYGIGAAVIAILLVVLIIAVFTGGDSGLSRAEVEEITSAAMSNAPAPAAAGLPRAEVERIAQAAVSDIPRPEAGITRAEAEEIARAAMSNRAAPPAAGLTRSDVEEIVRAAVSDIPQPEPALTRADVAGIAQAAIAETARQEPGLSEAEVRLIARNAVASIPPKSAPSDYTKFFVDNAISKYEAEGLEPTLDYYNSASSVDGQWYVFIVDDEDRIIGHYDPHLLGQDLKGPIGTDAEGYNFAPSMLAATGEGKWVSYVYDNPAGGGADDGHLGATELKHAWVVRHDGLLFGSGWYTTADEYTRFVVDQAIERYHDYGLEAALGYYNSADSLDGQWYVAIADDSGSVIGHYNPDFIGRDIAEVVGADGFRITEAGEWVSGADINPLTGESQPKHFWIISHDSLVFASGWHHRHDESLPR